MHLQMITFGTNLFIAPRPWLPNTSNWMLSFSTASYIATLGSPTSVTVSATIYSKEQCILPYLTYSGFELL